MRGGSWERRNLVQIDIDAKNAWKSPSKSIRGRYHSTRKLAQALLGVPAANDS